MLTNQQSSTCSLFVFAHPDDEFGCYESIYQCVDRGIRVVCVYLTDGGYAGQSVARRQAESIAVLSRLGVAREDVEFIGVRAGIEDGVLHERMELAARELASVLSRVSALDGVYVPAWEGGHADHDAAHAIALTVCKSLGLTDQLWQYSLYNAEGVCRPLFKVLSPLLDNGACVVQRLPLGRRLLYLKYCLSYPSQWKTWVGIFPFVLFKLLFVGRYEIQRVSVARLDCRPHVGDLLYERRGAIRYEDVGALIVELYRQYGDGFDKS